MLRDNFNEWQKAVSQVLTYMARNSNRYGFILTETNLVVLRLTRQPIDAGMSRSRPQRVTTTGFIHQRDSSDVSMASTGFSGSAYSDNDPEHWAYYNPEYVVVEWTASGQGKLTIKLALWALAMMATNGDRYIDYSYPGLDTWRWGDGHYVHNSSGATKTSLSQHEIHQESHPAGGNCEITAPGSIQMTSDVPHTTDQSQLAEESAGEPERPESPDSHRKDIPIHRHGNALVDTEAQCQPYSYDLMGQP
ncbi:hypothetical protein FDECE_14785, partial [Fusarium decemcellulare]